MWNLKSTWRALLVAAAALALSASPASAVTAGVSPAPLAPPTVTISSPAEGQNFTLGQRVDVVFSCAPGVAGGGLAAGAAVTACYGPGGSGINTSGVLDTSQIGEADYVITARSADGQSASAVLNYYVAPKNPQRIFIDDPGFAAVGDAPLDLHASSSSGLAVGLAVVTPSGSGAVCSVAVGLVTFLAPGECVITATQPGSDTFAAATPVTRHIAVRPGTQPAPTVTWANPGSFIYGKALGAKQLNATASAPGRFTYTPAAGTVLAPGAAQTLTVVFVPTDGSAAPVTKTVAITVFKIPTRLVARAVVAVAGTPANGRLSATLTRPDTGAAVAGKKVVFSVGGTYLCTGTTTAQGTATCTLAMDALKAKLAERKYTATFAPETYYASSKAQPPA